MSGGGVVWTGAAGALGAVLRYGLGLWLTALYPYHPFPWAILLANLSGSLLLGLVAGLAMRGRIPQPWQTPLTTGLLGGFTTFSTWSVDTLLLWQGGHGGLALANILLSLGLGPPLAWVGLQLGLQKTRSGSAA